MKFPQETDLVIATSGMNELGWIKGKVKELKNGTNDFLDAKEDAKNLCISNYCPQKCMKRK